MEVLICRRMGAKPWSSRSNCQRPTYRHRGDHGADGVFGLSNFADKELAELRAQRAVEGASSSERATVVVGGQRMEIVTRTTIHVVH